MPSLIKLAGRLALLAQLAAAAYVTSLPHNAQQMFNESMAWMDAYYDGAAGYLYDFSAAAALRHETRSSAWYALGLLVRNEGADVAEAEKIVNNIISAQFRVESEQWYGDYQQEPEEPTSARPTTGPWCTARGIRTGAASWGRRSW